MGNKLTPRQMINAELATRASNKKAAKILGHHVPQQEQKDLKIAFNCECADPDCQERIMLTLKEYEKFHKHFARFVIVKGHNEPQIETVEENKNNIAIVDKFALS